MKKTASYNGCYFGSEDLDCWYSLRLQTHRYRPDIETLWKTKIRHWFRVNSYGKYNVDPHVVEWFVTDDTEYNYADNKQGMYAGLQNAMWPKLDELDADPGWDWSQFDLDQDGNLDSVGKSTSVMALSSASSVFFARR